MVFLFNQSKCTSNNGKIPKLSKLQLILLEIIHLLEIIQTRIKTINVKTNTKKSSSRKA